MIYLDTNVLLSLLVQDAESENAETWYLTQPAPIAISRWVIAEFFASVNLRRRKEEVNPVLATTAIAALEEQAEKNFVVIPTSNEAAVLAASWLRNPDCNLQTGDALHLAIAHKGGATTLATFDDRFAKAAKKLKLHSLKIVLIAERMRRVEQKRAAYKVDSDINRKQAKKTVQRKKSK
jgi:uncharacterized protein